MRDSRLSRLALHLVFAFLCLVLVAQGRVAVAAPSAVERARDAWQAGRIDEALRESRLAVEQMPTSAYAWSFRAFLLSRAGRKQEALVAYDRAAVIAPGDAVVHNNRGAVLLDLDQGAEAESAFRHALELRPDYADALNNLGALHELGGRAQQAAASYRAATAADPGHAHAHSNLGALAMRQGRDEEARQRFERARGLDPTLGAPTLNLLLLGGRDFASDEMLDALREAARRPDASDDVRAGLLAALAGRMADAGRHAEAHALYLEAYALDPEDALLLNNMAVVEDRLGLERDAILHLEAALVLQPNLLVARNNIGIVHVHHGRLESAEDVFRFILERDTNFHRAHYNLGVVLGARGSLPEALQSFERAALLAPQDAEIRYNIGLLRRRLGGSAAAERQAYEAALALDPDLGEAHLSLGCFLADPQTRADLRDEVTARRHLERFLEVASPRDSDGRAQANAWLAWLRR